MLQVLGGVDNIAAVSNCMTRLRIVVRDEAVVDVAKLRELEDVLGLVHDRACSYEIVVGPGKSRKYADQFRALGCCTGIGENRKWDADRRYGERAELQNAPKNSRFRNGLKLLGDIFVPLIPGIITAGLCGGFAALIAQTVPGYENSRLWSIVWDLLTLFQASFMTYLTAWAGYRAAERFGATPILGGMLGMITSLDMIDEISRQLGLYDAASPLNSVLRTGKGGILAVIFGVFLLSAVEKKIRSRIPESLDVIFTPLLSLLFCAVPYILVVMPLFGYVSNGIVWLFSRLCLSESVMVRIITGYISAALFLPLVAAGMHHGMVALYSVQLQELGYITLYPALAMAGAGQVGASVALWIKAKKRGDRKLCSIIAGALPAGFLGVGEPLIYGVTLPLGRPFLTAGLGAGFGGALVMAMEVSSTTWGPSGILGIFVMTAGPAGAVKGVLFYLAGLLLSYFCSFLITFLACDITERQPVSADTDMEEEPSAGSAVKSYAIKSAQPERSVPVGPSESYRTVRHGDPVVLGGMETGFRFTVTDPVGLHARPAGMLAELVRKYDCTVTFSANGKTASAASPIELLELGAAQGTVLTVSSEGREAGAALQAVRAFLEETLKEKSR